MQGVKKMINDSIIITAGIVVMAGVLYGVLFIVDKTYKKHKREKNGLHNTSN